MTDDDMAGWHHQLDGREFEQALRTGDGQGSLACCSPWGRKESDTTKRLNNNNQDPQKLCNWLTVTEQVKGRLEAQTLPHHICHLHK